MFFIIKTIIIVIIIGYLGFLIFTFLFSNRIMFPSPRASYADTPTTIKLKTEDGQVITATYLPNKQARYVILVSHGNAEDLGHIMPFLQAFNRKGFAIFAYDYHGYGASTGIPTEKAVYQDVDAAYNYLTNNLHYVPKQIIVYGRSIGSGPATDIALRQPVAGLILESPFTTAFRVVTQIPILPFDKFNNLKKIKQLHCPVLIIHGTHDFIVPFWHGKKIYKEAKQPKTFLIIPGYGHNDAPWYSYPDYWPTIHKFVNEL